MSSKKDNQIYNNRKFMILAMNLASQNVGLTGMNPSVGSVIVKNNNILSVGTTGFGGKPHSEYIAIKKCKSNLKDSTIYISLEPCSHYGKTPPCTKSIINSGIKKVYFAIEDIDKRSSNKAKKILNKKKIKVVKNYLFNNAKKLYNSYFYSKINKIPYISGKIACSNDNYISSKNKYITNKHSLKVSHLLRYKNDGLLVSYKTINSDNSKLTCRIKGLEQYSPKRFIIDKNVKIKKNSNVINNARSYKTYIFYNKISISKKKYLIRKGVKLVFLKLNEKEEFNLIDVLKKIYKLGVSSLIIEGGKKLTNDFLDLNLFNEFFIFRSNLSLGYKGKINISNIIKKLPIKFKNKEKIDTYLYKDRLINYY